MRRARAVLGLALLATPLAGQAVVGLAPSTILLSQGGRATVPLVANLTNAGGAQLGAYQMQVTFNPAVLRYVGVAPGAFGTPTVNAASAATGTVVFAGANPGGAGGVVTLANLTFEMLVASGSSPAAIASPQLTAATTFAPIAVNAVSASFCTAAGTFGDVDDDGNVLGNDALIVVTAAVGLPITPYTLSNADVDQTGTVDTRDALFILSYAVGLPTLLTRVGQPNAGACGGPAPQTLALQPSPVQLAPGDILALVPNALDSTGIPTAAHGLAWSSTNLGVATVDTLGIVTAVANGSDSIIAMTVAGPADTAVITVTDRHTWYVNGAVTTALSQQLGSSAFPFATIPQALNRAAARDTVRIAVAPGAYGPATIAKPVVVLGDSGASGMPTISNSTGAALSVNTSGRVVLQWLNLDQSNAGLDATGDTLEVQSLAMDALRGIGLRVHGMQRADLRDVHVTSATLAGIWVDNTPSVAVTGAALAVIAARNDSAVGVAVLNTDVATLTDVTVFGVDSHGPGIIVDSANRANIVNYASNTGSPLAVQRARFAGVTGAVLANGGCGGVSSNCVAAIHFKADTAVIDTVLLVGPGGGIAIKPHQGSGIPSQVKITRSVMTGVQFGTAVQIDSMADVTITGLTVDTVFYGDGIALSHAGSVALQQVALRHVCDVCSSLGAGVIVGAMSTGGSVSLQHVDVHSAPAGGVSVDSAFVVRLLGVRVDSSASPNFQIFNAPVRFAVRVTHADTVHADSLNLHDNIGAGLLVDSALVVTGTGSLVARNFGQGGFGGECGPNGCTCEICDIKGEAPRYAKSAVPPIFKGGVLSQFVASSAPGVVLSNVTYGRLAHFTVDSNAHGGILLAPSNISAWTFILDTSVVRGPQVLLEAAGYIDSTGHVTVQGSHFQGGAEGIDANYLDQITVAASTFDSVALTGTAINVYAVNSAVFSSDTIREGAGSGIEFGAVGNAQVTNSLIHHRVPYNINNPEAALGFNTTSAGAVSGTRIEFNTVRGIRVDGSIGGPIVIDGNSITDQGSVALQLSGTAQVTRNFIARNFVGIDVFNGAEASGIRLNNFGGNTLAALRGQGLSPVAADSNYWNDLLGPTCASGCTSTVGDTINGLVAFLPFLTDPSQLPVGTPTLAPPRRAASQQVRQGKP